MTWRSGDSYEKKSRVVYSMPKSFFFNIFFFKLKCSWFTMLCQSLLYSKVPHLCSYIHSFFILFSIMAYHRIPEYFFLKARE